MDAACSPSLAASMAAEANAGSSQRSKAWKVSPRFHSLRRAQPAGEHAADGQQRSAARSWTAGDSWMCAATSGFTRDLP